MVLIDTSVWIRLFRAADSRLGSVMVDLEAQGEIALCGPVYVEFIGGFRNARTRSEAEEKFVHFRWLPVEKESFEIAAEWTAATAGLSAIDAIIAAIAYGNDASLLTLDDGFKQLTRFGLRLYPLSSKSN